MLWYHIYNGNQFFLEVKNAAGGELQMNRIFCFLILLSETSYGWATTEIFGAIFLCPKAEMFFLRYSA
jgi:hypothetical protein